MAGVRLPRNPFMWSLLGSYVSQSDPTLRDRARLRATTLDASDGPVPTQNNVGVPWRATALRREIPTGLAEVKLHVERNDFAPAQPIR